ncbi:hypothetical protein Tco_0324102 [Tanacetum coccineum]
MYPEIKQLAIKRVDEYGFVIRPDLVRLTSGSVGPFYSINTVPVIRFAMLASSHYRNIFKADNTIRVNQLVTILLIKSSIHLLDLYRYPVDTADSYRNLASNLTASAV